MTEVGTHRSIACTYPTCIYRRTRERHGVLCRVGMKAADDTADVELLHGRSVVGGIELSILYVDVGIRREVAHLCIGKRGVVTGDACNGTSYDTAY